MSVSITTLTRGTTVVQRNPDNTPRRTLHTVVVAGVNLAYCDTEQEAEAVIAAINKLRTAPGLTP